MTSQLRNHFTTNPVFKLFYHTAFLYPVPININYLWNFGVLALITLVCQLITGIFLGMHYVPNTLMAFASVEHIMRDVNGGYLIRYLHANGASMFFFIVYCHLFRGLYFGSFYRPRDLLWNIGVIIFLLMVITAFLGYVLPWGQMSYWAATVITNLASVIPGIGHKVLYFLWGGFSVSNATLNKFFSLHFLLPFVIVSLSLLHVCFLHLHGSSNPLGVDPKETITFSPFFLIKDYFSLISYFIAFVVLVAFVPNFVNHPDNYIMANPLSTPAHIVPEWYLLAFYAVLRSVPHKLLGVLALVFSILVLMVLPVLNPSSGRSARFRPFYKPVFWFFFGLIILLSFIGGHPAEAPYILIGQLATGTYFFSILVVIPVFSIIEWKNVFQNHFTTFYSFSKKVFRRISREMRVFILFWRWLYYH